MVHLLMGELNARIEEELSSLGWVN